MVSLWAMSAQMCTQSIVALHIKKALGIFKQQQQQQQQLEWLSGTGLAGPKMDGNPSFTNCEPQWHKYST